MQECRSEEDVKDVYIAALGLKSYTKGLIDIQTDEVWFEAKDTGRHSAYAMFTQLLHYVQDALNKGEKIPPFLAVIDTEKAAIMRTKDVLPFLKKKTIKWGKSASQYTQDALEQVSSFIGTHFVLFKIRDNEQEFISAVKSAIKTGEIVRTQITPDNLKQVFDKWVDMIGREITSADESDYALLFFADIMSDGNISTHRDLPVELIHSNGEPAFAMNGKIYKLGSKEGYRKFWAIYHRPPKEEYRNYLLERRDSLIPTDSRIFKGAYYTPLHVVDKAYDELSKALGKNWQKDYFVWDMCCGVGNLEVKHSNHRKVFMSTLDQEDVDVMVATRTCVAANRFQYDYLNDDIDEQGDIDYSLTGKMPKELIEAIKSNKKILVLINPPYAEATNASNTTSGIEAKNKSGVAKSKFAETAMSDYGKATNELFTQFLARIAKEIPRAKVAVFSKMKYVNSPNFEKFRKKWSAKFLGGFVVHSKAFDGLKGHFPIGFCIWDTFNDGSRNHEIDTITLEALDKDANPIGMKSFYNIPSADLLSKWIERPRANKKDVLPLKNVLTPTDSINPRVTKWSDGAIGYMCAGTNDVQNASQYTYLLSSAASRGNGFYVNEKNLKQASAIFSVNKLTKATWLNDRDQFTTPTSNVDEEFLNDCLVYMLFNNSNLSASADKVYWSGREWSLVNHFIPYTEQDVNSAGRFESDFMVRYMEKIKFSRAANDVLKQGKSIWAEYFKHADSYLVREKLYLNRDDVGWYQVRNALKHRNESGDYQPVSFKSFDRAYKSLEQKLKEGVIDFGFLKV